MSGARDEELRELPKLLAEQYDPDAWDDRFLGTGREAEALQRRAESLEWVEGFLGIIAEAGYRIVDAGRLERLRLIAVDHVHEYSLKPGGIWLPGDLDPLDLVPGGGVTNVE